MAPAPPASPPSCLVREAASSSANPQLKTTRRGGSTVRKRPAAQNPSAIRTRYTPPGTGSRSASLPIHCTYRLGSVKKPNTSSGAAGTWTVTSTGAISVTPASLRVEPLVETLVMAGQLADLHGAAGAEHRAAAGQRHGRVQASGPDQRVPAERGVGDAGAQRASREPRVAAVLEPGAELELPARPGAERIGRGRVARRRAEREQVSRHTTTDTRATADWAHRPKRYATIAP